MPESTEGVVVILYPLIANRLAEKNASLIETQYTERIETLYDTELQELRDRAQRYNGTLQTATGAAFSKEALPCPRSLLIVSRKSTKKRKF